MDIPLISQLLKVLLVLAFVSVLAWLCIAWLKRLQEGRLRRQGADTRPGDMRFLRALPVGSKERVVVLQYRGEEWLLGVSPGGISLLNRSGSSTPQTLPGVDPILRGRWRAP